MLVYMEGFDQHREPPSGLYPGGSLDDGRYWFGSTFSFPQYFSGYQEGRARVVSNVSHHNQRWDQVLKVGFWSRYIDVGNVSTGWLFRVGRGNSCYGLFADADGSVRLAAGEYVPSSPTQGDRVETPNYVYKFDPQHPWTYVELTIDFAAQTVSGTVNNQTQTISGTYGASSSGPGSLSFGSYGPNVAGAAPVRILHDHFWCARDELEGNEILGVAVTGFEARYLGVNMFAGALIMGGERYQTDPVLVNPTSRTEHDGNVVHHLYPRNPMTGQPWDVSGLNSIEAFGLCFVSAFSSTVPNLVSSISLSVMYANNGQPVIKTYHAGPSAFFSGVWNKSHPDMSYQWHIDQIPRPVGQTSEVKHLTSEGGCLLFTPMITDDPPEIFPQVGLTFAEKNAVNHRDWTKVDGVGERANAYFVSGYGVYGESNKKFQSNYVSVNYETAVGGQAYIQGVWDYSVNPDTGRWSMRQQVYGPKTVHDFKHGTRKLKIRGHGKAIQLKVTSFQDAPFILNGWAVFVTSNTAV